MKRMSTCRLRMHSFRTPSGGAGMISSGPSRLRSPTARMCRVGYITLAVVDSGLFAKRYQGNIILASCVDTLTQGRHLNLNARLLGMIFNSFWKV